MKRPVCVIRCKVSGGQEEGIIKKKQKIKMHFAEGYFR